MAPSKPNYLSKASSPNTIKLGVRTSTYELFLEGDTNIYFITSTNSHPPWLKVDLRTLASLHFLVAPMLN